MVETANYIWRDWNTDGVPASQISKPEKRLIREWGTWVEALLGSGSAGGTWYATRALMNADLAHDAGTLGIVYADPNPALNGMYVKQGASGAGSWTQISNQLPTGAAVVAVTVTGGGPNALTASFNPNTQFSPGQAIYILRGIAADNTGPITINGKPYRTNLGNDFVAGGIKAGGVYLFVDNGPEYRTLTDQDIAALVAAAEDAADRAEAAATAAEGLVPNSFPPTRADMAAQENTIVNSYLIEPGFEGYYHIVDITSGDYDDLIAADTVGGEIVVTDDNLNLAYLRQRKNGDYIKTSEYGHNLHVAIAAASERAKLIGPDAIVDLEMNWYGTRLIEDAALIWPANVNPIGLGKGITKLDPSNLVDGQLVSFGTGQIASGGRVFFDARANPGNAIGDAYTDLPEFNPIIKDSPRIEFLTATGLKLRDVLIVQDTADFSWLNITGRETYKKGDRFEVTGIIPGAVGGVGDIVYVDHAFRDDYTYSATVRAYKQQVRRGRMGGFSIEAYDPAVTNMQIFEIAGWQDGVFDDVDFFGRAAYGFSFSQTINGRGNPTAFINLGVDRGSANLYAILTNNATRMHFKGGRAGSNWHATDMGGGAQDGNVLNYAILFENYDLFGSDINTTGQAGMHGNSDLSGYRYCNAARAFLSGRDPFYTNGTLISVMGGSNMGSQLVTSTETHAGVVNLDGTVMRSSRNTGTTDGGSSGMIRVTPLAVDAKGEVFVSMLGVTIDAPNEQQPIVIGPNGGTENAVSLNLQGVVNLPAVAVSEGLVRVWGPSDGLSVEASHLHIDVKGPWGVGSGVPFVTSFQGSAGPTTFRERSFKPWNEGVWTTASAAVAVETSAPISFEHPYPANYTPKCWAMQQSAGKGTKAFAGIFSRTNSQIRPDIKSGDGTNMNAASVDVAWWAK